MVRLQVRVGTKRISEVLTVSLLAVSDLRKSFDQGRTMAVDGLSFQIEPGEVFGLLGPNGAGKTTSMSIVAGLLNPDGGELQFDGSPVNSTDHRFRRALGFVPQDLAIYPDLTARENMVFFGRLYGLRRDRLAARVSVALDMSGLEAHADRPAGEFSGGMKRRLNFATGLLHEPQLLMLDEPTVGVDPQSRAHLLDCVRRLRDSSVAVLYASHYMDEVESICDRVAIVDHGKVVVSGALDELLGRLHLDLRVQVAGGDDDVASRVAGLTSVTGVDDRRSNGHGERTLLIQTTRRSRANDDLTNLLNALLEKLAECNCRVLSVATQESSLERLFLQLTGRHLRD